MVSLWRNASIAATIMRLAIVIPTLDEERGLPRCLPRALEAGDEVCVSDGGSRDATVELARSHGARVVVGPAGRGPQLNRGARATDSEILLFLHADTHLPADALDEVRETLTTPGVSGGCFRTRFVGEGARSAWMRLWEAPIWMKWWRFAFGDRAPFMTRETFGAIGGFRRQPLFEDLDLVRDLRTRGRFVFLDSAVETSARRFGKHGALGQQLRNLALWTGWNVGLSPERLARYYPVHRPAD